MYQRLAHFRLRDASLHMSILLPCTKCYTMKNYDFSHFPGRCRSNETRCSFDLVQQQSQNINRLFQFADSCSLLEWNVSQNGMNRLWWIVILGRGRVLGHACTYKMKSALQHMRFFKYVGLVRATWAGILLYWLNSS